MFPVNPFFCHLSCLNIVIIKAVNLGCFPICVTFTLGSIPFQLGEWFLSAWRLALGNYFTNILGPCWLINVSFSSLSFISTAFKAGCWDRLRRIDILKAITWFLFETHKLIPVHILLNQYWASLPISYATVSTSFTVLSPTICLIAASGERLRAGFQGSHDFETVIEALSTRVLDDPLHFCKIESPVSIQRFIFYFDRFAVYQYSIHLQIRKPTSMVFAAFLTGLL